MCFTLVCLPVFIIDGFMKGLKVMGISLLLVGWIALTAYLFVSSLDD